MQQKILIISANPKGTTPLRLDEEVREIDAGLKRARNRDQFVLEHSGAVRPRDIQRAMLDLNPQIVHFSGHGTGDEGLVFEDETGSAKLVDSEALAGLFDLFADQLKCVVLSGCYSEVQANAIAQHIPYVIGMNQAIGDRAAIEFAVGFYDALGAGKPVEFAYKFGCAAIRLAGIPEQLTPTLKKKLFNESKDQPLVPSELESELDQKLNGSDRELLTAKAYNNRGNAYYLKQDYDSAIADFNQALKLDSDFVNPYYNRGLVYYDKKNYDDAIADFNQALKLDPNFAKAYYNRGLVYHDKKDYDSAIADFNQALKLDPNFAKAYYNRGLVYRDKKDYDSAIADYNQALKLNPNFANPYLSLENAFGLWIKKWFA